MMQKHNDNNLYNDMIEPQISVVIPVYNVEKYLRQCLDSILNQTLKNIEVICVDDGSSDSSLDILHDYQKRDTRVKVFTQNHKFAGCARNLGMDQARGKYLLFLDSDDFFEKNLLEKTYNVAEKHDLDVVLYKADRYFEEDDKFVLPSFFINEKVIPVDKVFDINDIKPNVYCNIPGYVWNKLFRRKFIVERHLRFQTQEQFEDGVFAHHATILASKMYFIPEILLHQRMRAAHDSLTDKRVEDIQSVYLFLKGIEEFLKTRKLYDEYKRDFINYAVHMFCAELNHKTSLKKRELVKRIRNEWIYELDIINQQEDYFYDKKKYRKFYENIYQDFIAKTNLHEEVETLNKEKRVLEAKVKQLETKINDIQSGTSFRIGHIITWLPRKLLGRK